MAFNLSIFRHSMVFCYSSTFFLFSFLLVLKMFHDAGLGLVDGENFIGTLIKAINTAVISLAMFELGLVVSKEYGGREAGHHIVVVLRRTVPRFISIVCIALALEGLLLVIKYSQLDLAGNLYYPVAIIVAAAILLTGLGVFLHFSSYSELAEERHKEGPASRHDCVPNAPTACA